MGEYRPTFSLDALMAQRPPLPPRPLSRASPSSRLLPSDDAERDAIAALSFSLPPRSHHLPPAYQPEFEPVQSDSRHRSTGGALRHLCASVSLDDVINSFTSAPPSTTLGWAPPLAVSHPAPDPPAPTPQRAKRKAQAVDPDADFMPTGHHERQSRSVSTEHDEEKRAARGRPKGVKDGPNVDKTRRGRPKGTKNVMGTKREREEREREALGLGPVEKKKRGRPAGSKNKFKDELVFDQMEVPQPSPTEVASSPPPPSPVAVPATLPQTSPTSPIPTSPTPSTSSLSTSPQLQRRPLPLPSRTTTTGMTFLSSQEPRFRLKANVSYDRERMADESEGGGDPVVAPMGYSLVDAQGWATISTER